MGHFGALATCSPFETLTSGQHESFTVLGTLTNGMLTLTLAFMTFEMQNLLTRRVQVIILLMQKC